MTLESQPMGLLDRLKAAGQVITSGKLPNPLAQEPKDQSRAALVKELTTWCRSERAFWKPIFDRIRQEQDFAAGKQWPTEYKTQGDEPEPYVGDVMQQMLNRKTASLYAKNPTPEAKQREKLLFSVWDGSQESLNGARAIVQQSAQLIAQAQASLAIGQQPPPPPAELQAAKAILDDYAQGTAQKAKLERIAKTASLLLKYEWDSQSPEFLVQMKQLVTRILTSRVAFIKVMYRRDVAETPTESANENNLAQKFATLQQLLAKLNEADFDPSGPEAEQARLLMQELSNPQQQPTESDVEDEGLVYDFLSATSVIVDRNCTCLREFVGARRIAHEMILSVAEAETKFGISLRDTPAVLYTEDGCKEAGENTTNEIEDEGERLKGNVCCWHLEDKDIGLCYVLIDGLPEFVKEPYVNRPRVKRFWSIVPVLFNVQNVERNQPEKDVTIYPRSDVRLAMPMQIDINRAGEGLREHRVANRPWWVAIGSRWMDNDLQKLSGPRAAHQVLRLESLSEGEKIGDFIQAGPQQPIDPRLYDPSPAAQAMMLATGVQPANLGAQRPDEKATGQAIAEGSRVSAEQSNVDDLDFCLSIIAQMSWEMLIQEMPEATVKKIVGPGAVWPQLAREEVADEIFLQIEAGSSGRPNKGMEISNFEKLAPLLTQAMVSTGKSLDPLIKEGARRLDDKIDPDDFLRPGQLQTGQLPNLAVGPAPVQPGPALPSGAPAPNIVPPRQTAPSLQPQPQPGHVPLPTNPQTQI